MIDRGVLEELDPNHQWRKRETTLSGIRCCGCKEPMERGAPVYALFNMRTRRSLKHLCEKCGGKIPWPIHGPNGKRLE